MRCEENDGDTPERRGDRGGTRGELVAHGGEKMMGGEALSRGDGRVGAVAVGGGGRRAAWTGGWTGGLCPARGGVRGGGSHKGPG